MNTELILTICSFLGTIIGTLGGIITANKLTMYRIQQLENKVEKHNQVIDRVYKLEQDKAVIVEEIKVANHRIADIEEVLK